jgi:peptidoglycan hydrolase-like protein with peptidoglycan-binding domain
VECEDMTLDKLYKLGSKGIGVRFIQKVLNEDIKPTPLLIVDGIWGTKTTDAVKQYQTFYGLKIDGLVGTQTMRSMILEYPEIWNDTEYDYSIGIR